MPIDHVGLGVPDVEAAGAYYDQLMPMLGLHPCFGNGYCPTEEDGSQLFLYSTVDEDGYSRYGPGLHHVAFRVSTRTEVDAVHEWVRDRGDPILHPPRLFPQFGDHYYATYFLDPHSFKLEVVCPTAAPVFRD